MDLVPLVYFERQQGLLCAQHCINNLLQNEYFSAVDLADLAQQCDQDELKNMQSSENHTQSDNYDDSGFFSIQVVARALQCWNINLVSIASQEYRTNFVCPRMGTKAFICNFNQHWLTLRMFGQGQNRWYDLNSMHSQPRHISCTFLDMYLLQLAQEGYSIYAIEGILPDCKADQYAVQVPEPPESSKNIWKADKGYRLGKDIAQGQDPELEAALKRSMEEDDNSGFMKKALVMSMEDGDCSVNAALEMSLEDGDDSIRLALEMSMEDDDDDTLKTALKMSMAENVDNDSIKAAPKLSRGDQNNSVLREAFRSTVTDKSETLLQASTRMSDISKIKSETGVNSSVEFSDTLTVKNGNQAAQGIKRAGNSQISDHERMRLKRLERFG